MLLNWSWGVIFGRKKKKKEYCNMVHESNWLLFLSGYPALACKSVSSWRGQGEEVVGLHALVEWKASVDVMSCSVAIIKWFNLSESSRLSIWPCEWSRLLLLIWKCAASSLELPTTNLLNDPHPQPPPLTCTLISLFSFSNNLHNHHTERETAACLLENRGILFSLPPKRRLLHGVEKGRRITKDWAGKITLDYILFSEYARRRGSR